MRKITLLLLTTLFVGSIFAQSREVVNPTVGGAKYSSSLTITKVELGEGQTNIYVINSQYDVYSIDYQELKELAGKR